MKIGFAANANSMANAANSGNIAATGSTAVRGALALGAGQSKPSAADMKSKFNQYLNQTMVETMLKESRKASQMSPLFSGGRGEEIFGAQLDQTLAEKIGSRMATHTGGAGLSHLATLGRK
jgi:hypothetical protein